MTVVAGQAPAYFRAVAIDFDGTLADGRVTPGTLAALAEARARQIRVILVTGRIVSELLARSPIPRTTLTPSWRRTVPCCSLGRASFSWPRPSTVP